ncbi:hypothetical protein [Candidatus Parabeggiatoa sp. HSG14]|uniref:hypothetical protein n=1 Tax=Candidatus Parabeggiatoa sp. HSG14 TaxID=3055593 RepID=UPI0025A8FB3A|nr:hypothetical protein [Thiotrichales bacterium HSG14]
MMYTTNLSKLSYILIIAVLTTAIFNPETLVIWTQNLPVNPITDTLLEVTEKWRDLMDGLGLTKVFDKLRELFRLFQEMDR